MSMELNLADAVDVFEHARTVDFLRYVAGERRDRPEIDKWPFATAWNVMVGGYAAMALNTPSATELA